MATASTPSRWITGSTSGGDTVPAATLTPLTASPSCICRRHRSNACADALDPASFP